MGESEGAIKRTSLNGWWDFQPVFSDDARRAVPAGGWAEGAYLVPSVWTKPAAGVRKPGERQFHSGRALQFDGDEEFLFDAFEYPIEWARTRCGWARRRLTVGEIPAGRRRWLRFDAVLDRCVLYLNGERLAEHEEAMLPLALDVTDRLRPGHNEVALLIDDFPRQPSGRTLRPSGNGFTLGNSGIWQDVWLIERGEVYLDDVTIRTSVRSGRLWARFVVANASGRERRVSLRPAVVDWRKGLPAEDAPVVLDCPQRELIVPAGGTATAEVEADWPGAEWWYPERPRLYQVRTRIEEDGRAMERHFERFGFREVWIDGPRLMLNDYPLHLASDWGHKSSVFHLTEGWIRQWYGMIRDANMNHTRLHNLPHPPLYLDIADEEGILVTGETALNGAGKVQAADEPEYWQAAERHLRRFIRRDKNRPSVVLWSVENEMRWNDQGIEQIRAELPRLRRLAEQLDPTRPVYNDGDTSLWNEKTQAVISRHYGKAGAGVGWWDRQQPLLTSEMCLYHQMGPHNTLHLAGDAVYADHALVAETAGLDLRLIVEAGRALGVSCFGPWNLSTLTNLRMEPQRVELSYEDFTTPGMKPLAVPAHSSEFAFWRRGKGYTPHRCFAPQRHAFRPLAVIDTSLRTGYFAGARLRRQLTVVNDTPGPVEGELVVALRHGGETLHEQRRTMSLPRGERASETFEALLPTGEGECLYAAVFHAGGEVRDAWERALHVRARAATAIEELVAVLGPGHLRSWLKRVGVPHRYVDSPAADAVGEFRILLIEKDAVQPGTPQNRRVRAFCRRGGRAIVMEQRCSLLPQLKLEGKMVIRAFARAAGHPLLDGVDDADLFAWGDDPYPKSASDSTVALRMYRKDDGRLALWLLDSGEGNWGAGDLEFSPLLEAPEGDGLVIACQLRLTDKLADIPAAERMLVNLLRRAATYQPPAPAAAVIVDGAETDGLDRYVEQARGGATVIVKGATPAALAAWSQALGMPLAPREVGEVYSVVRAADESLLAGVSNHDTCGVETFFYCGPQAANHRVAATVLAPSDGLEPLLVTPTNNCLRELFVRGGFTEPLATHTRSRFLFSERPLEAVALGRVRLGRGAVLFNQFAPPADKRLRFGRLDNRLRANLGERFDGSLLDGDAVPPAAKASPGYPQSAELFNAEVDGDLRREMLQCTHLHLEEHKCVPILNIPGWRTTAADDGVFRAAGLDLSNDVWLYYHAVSPMARAVLNPQRPDPGALTSVELAGEGEVELIVNARCFEPVTLDGGAALVEGIELQARWNHVLVRWHPASERSTLRMTWRDARGDAETDLEFKFCEP